MLPPPRRPHATPAAKPSPAPISSRTGTTFGGGTSPSAVSAPAAPTRTPAPGGAPPRAARPRRADPHDGLGGAPLDHRGEHLRRRVDAEEQLPLLDAAEI